MKKILLILIIAALGLTGCNKGEGGIKTKDDSNIIMVIGNESLTEEELKDKMRSLPPQYQEYSKTEQGREALIEELTVRKILKQEAIKEGIEKRDDYKKDMENAREALLIDHIINEKIVEGVKVTEEELEEEYEKNKESFITPEQVKASHILITVTNDMDVKEKRKAKLEAEKILKEVTPNNFKEMAKKYSQGPTSKAGGELGWFDKDSMVKEFADAAFTGVPGKIYGEIVETQFGYHVIYVEDKKEAGYMSLEDIKPSLEMEILNDKRTKEYQNWIESLKEEYIKN